MELSQLRASLSPLGWIETYQLESFVVVSLATLFAILFLQSLAPKKKSVEAPFVGYRGFWEPTLLLRLRFCQGAYPIVAEGYKKVSLFRIAAE